MNKEILKSNSIRYNDKIKLICLMAQYKKIILHPINSKYIPIDEDGAIKEYQNDYILNNMVNTLCSLIKDGLDL